MFHINFVGLLLIGSVTLCLLLNSCLIVANNVIDPPGDPIEECSSRGIVRRSIQPRRGLRLIKRIEKQFESKYFQKMITSFDRETSVMSPLGAFIPLFVMSFGARGPTRSKFISALQIDGRRSSRAKRGFRRWLQILAHGNIVSPVPKLLKNFEINSCQFFQYPWHHKLHIATKIYYPAFSLRPRLSFVDMASYYLNTTMESIELKDGHIPSKRINQWLSSQTNDRSNVRLYEPDIFENGRRISLLGPDPVMLLVSVVYFKGIWETGFNTAYTNLRPFTTLNGTTVNCMTMYNYGTYEYGELPEFELRFVKLPFDRTSPSNSVNMFIILPNARKSYRDLLSKLGKINVKDLYHRGTIRNVQLYLPKFRLESTIPLHDWLPTFLGDSNGSDSRATFDRIFVRSPEVRLGPSQSRAVIEIDEMGAVSEQATGYFYRLRKPRAIDTPISVEFKADHPFIAIIATGDDIILNLFTIFFDGRST